MTAVREILRTMDYGLAPESDEQARAWLAAHSGGFGHFIAGAFTPPGQLFDVFNPARGERIARVSQGTEADVAAAVAAARKALKSWSALSGDARARWLYALARHIQKRERLLAVLESLDNGKPIRESRDVDVPLVARHFYHHAGWASLIADEFPAFKPVGVCGQIIPWNFPLLMLAWKIAPALAAGNTVVLKPAEFTPLTALAFAEICVEVGLPPGVVNIVTGDGATGAALVENDDVDKIAFTGSTEVGRAIRQATAGTGKKLSLELGGKSPFVVFEDSDLDSAVEGVVDAIWFNQGQVCCAGSRLLVAESIAERMYAKLRARMETLRVGDPLDKSIDVGAIVAPVQLERIKRLVEAGEREGAKVWRAPGPLPERGCFYPPTLVTEVEPASILAREEIFGPVLAAMTFRTPDEAVALANNTRYGLAASVWTENVNRAFEVAAKIKAGAASIRHLVTESTGVDPGARGDLRAGAGGDDLPHARRSDRARQQHPLRPRRLGVDRERQSRVRSRREDQGRRGVDQFDQPVRRRLRVRRLSRERLRPRGRARRIGRIPRSAGGGDEVGQGGQGAPERAARPRAGARRRFDRPHRQALYRRQAGAARFRFLLFRARSGRQGRRPRGAGESQGHPQRGRGGGARRAAGARRPPTTAPRCSITSPRTSNRAARSSPRGSAPRPGRERARRAPKSRPRSGARSTTPASPTSTTARCTRPRRASSPWR